MKTSLKITGIIIILTVAVALGIATLGKHNNTKTTDMNTDEIQETAGQGEIDQTDGAVDVQTSQANVPEGAVTTTPATAMATFTTSMGEIDIELFSKDVPKTVENFTKLAQSGFYNGVRFHRVIPGFMIQSGDPLSKNLDDQDYWGTGGPGYKFADEIHENNHNNIGTLAMANAGPNTNGSQFFINVANNNFLDTKHTVFGKVVKGMDVVMAISQVETEGPDRPVDEVVIKSISVK